MLIIPTEALPAQTLTTQINGQFCRVNLYQKTTGLYVDLYVANAPVVVGIIALNANRIVRDAYRGFVGDLAVCDTQGASDPDYTGLAGRFQLVYYEASEL